MVKRITAVMLTTLVLCTMASCQDVLSLLAFLPIGSASNQELVMQAEDGTYQIKLPASGETVALDEEQVKYIPYITDRLITEAEKSIAEATEEHSERSGYYIEIGETGYLYLSMEVICYPPQPHEFLGCGDHEHVFFSEAISTKAIPHESETDETAIPLEALKTEDVKSVKVRLSSYGERSVEVNDVDEFLTKFRQIAINPYDNQDKLQYEASCVFDIVMADGTAVKLEVMHDSVVINGIRYKCKTDSCGELTEYARMLAQAQ